MEPFKIYGQGLGKPIRDNNVPLYYQLQEADTTPGCMWFLG